MARLFFFFSLSTRIRVVKVGQNVFSVCGYRLAFFLLFLLTAVSILGLDLFSCRVHCRVSLLVVWLLLSLTILLAHVPDAADNTNHDENQADYNEPCNQSRRNPIVDVTNFDVGIRILARCNLNGLI